MVSSHMSAMFIGENSDNTWYNVHLLCTKFVTEWVVVILTVLWMYSAAWQDGRSFAENI